MRYVLMLPSCDDLPEWALTAVRNASGLTVLDSFGATVLEAYDGDVVALKRQLPDWQVQPQTWLRPASAS